MIKIALAKIARWWILEILSVNLNWSQGVITPFTGNIIRTSTFLGVMKMQKKPERSLIFCIMTVKSLLSIMNRTCFHILKYLHFDSATLFLGDTFLGNDKQNFIAPKYRKRLGKNLNCFYLVDVTALCCKNKTRHPQNRDTSFVFIKFIWARRFQERLESSLKVQQLIYNIFLMSCNFQFIWFL